MQLEDEFALLNQLCVYRGENTQSGEAVAFAPLWIRMTGLFWSFRSTSLPLH